MRNWTWLDIVARKNIKEPTIEEQIQRVIEKEINDVLLYCYSDNKMKELIDVLPYKYKTWTPLIDN